MPAHMLWMRDEGRDGGQAIGERLEDQDGVEAGEAGAALVLGDVHRREAEGAGLGAGSARGMAPAASQVVGVGRDAVAAEVAGHVEDRRCSSVRAKSTSVLRG